MNIEQKQEGKMTANFGYVLLTVVGMAVTSWSIYAIRLQINSYAFNMPLDGLVTLIGGVLCLTVGLLFLISRRIKRKTKESSEPVLHK